MDFCSLDLVSDERASQEMTLGSTENGQPTCSLMGDMEAAIRQNREHLPAVGRSLGVSRQPCSDHSRRAL